MDAAVDVNKLAAEFIQANLDNAVEFASSKIKGARNVFKSKLERTYKGYLARILGRYSRAKSFFIRTEPVPLYDVFVPLGLANQVRKLPKASVIDVTSVAPCAIVTGSGGSGKTMLMRHLLVGTISARAKTPIFFELRDLNQHDQSLRDSLLDNVKVNGLEVDEDYFELALRAGHFCIMLDGFDELERGKRKRIAQEIQGLAQKYVGNWFIMSSRPDSQLEGWTAFTQLAVQPLDLESATELVTKLPCDPDVKEKFLDDLRDGLFARHNSFLSNPLLLSIMLLTYTDVAHIPDKLSIFYNQAYESLFHKHDALKGGFVRDRQSGLDIQDFGKAFAAFCLQSFDKREFAFSRIRALELLERGKKMVQLDYKTEAVLDDAEQAVCLLIEEGIELTFSHRSFQEYFVARFIYASPPEVKGQLVRHFSPTVQSDSVIALLYELDPYSVERYYILPMLSSLRKKLKVGNVVTLTHFLRYVQLVFSVLSVGLRADDGSDQLSATIADLPTYLAARFAYERYGEAVSKPIGEVEKGSLDVMRNALKRQVGTNRGFATKDLTIANPILRAMTGAPGNWGMQYLRGLLDIERLISKRHREAKSSLENIIG
ncbi:MAG: NACHT domain-containing protein [Deltaproteobacteria bacterium]|nr:NACHT domain-containing protein [Deltaproteobacteria bacterium]